MPTLTWSSWSTTRRSAKGWRPPDTTSSSRTPGKRADIILLRANDINMTPIGDPYEALVHRAQPINVDTVIVDGRILRQAGKFTTLDHAKVVRDGVEAGQALRGRAKWPT